MSDSGHDARLIPIGRFAQLAGFTVRALRHYESQGLLLPARVDRESGYRYYRAEQLPDALRVRLLRALEMPLPEVVDVMRAPDSPEAIAKIRAHRARVAERVRDVEKLLERVDEWLDGAPQELEAPTSALDDAPRSASDAHRVNENLARTFLGLFGPGDEP